MQLLASDPSNEYSGHLVRQRNKEACQHIAKLIRMVALPFAP
jgi:hypothetical protein